jgi:DNA-binding response OmpR family regulator
LQSSFRQASLIKNTARRRLPGGPWEEVSVKPITRVVLESTARRMSIDGTTLPLTTVEYEILSRLAAAAGSIVCREQLIAEVFERQFNPEVRALDVHIHRLRKKLGPYGWLLVTVRGSGHMLRAFAPQPKTAFDVTTGEQRALRP